MTRHTTSDRFQGVGLGVLYPIVVKVPRIGVAYPTSNPEAFVDADLDTLATALPGTCTASRCTLHAAVGVASAEPHGATRWDFAH